MHSPAMHFQTPALTDTTASAGGSSGVVGEPELPDVAAGVAAWHLVAYSASKWELQCCRHA